MGQYCRVYRYGLLKFALLGAVAFVSEAQATDLLGVYNQALLNDQTYKKAEATFLANKQLAPIARSYLLPSLAAQGTYNPWVYGSTAGASVHSSNLAYKLTLTQSIFSWSAWAGMASANYSVKAAGATYFAAAQQLIYDTASAYFAVLQDADALRYNKANAQAFYHQLKTAKAKYSVGLQAVTNVYAAQAKYDQALAAQISNRTKMSNDLVQLQVLTNHQYRFLKTLSGPVPLIRPQPYRLSAWESQAEKKNYQIQATIYATLAAEQKMKAESASRWPSLSAEGTWGQSKTMGSSNRLAVPNVTATTAAAGLSIGFSPYQGGLIGATTEQYRQQYLQASAERELTHRTVLSAARSSFLGVASGISQINADLEAIRSSLKNYESQQAAQAVGRATEVEVLLTLSSLYQVQNQYAQDEYAYILNTLALKKAAGTLSVKDLQQINSWLSAKLSMKQNKTGTYDVTFSHIGPRREARNHAKDVMKNLGKKKAPALPTSSVPPSPATSKPASPAASVPVNPQSATQVKPSEKPVAAPKQSVPSQPLLEKPALKSDQPPKVNPQVKKSAPAIAMPDVFFSIQVRAMPTAQQAEEFIAKHHLKNYFVIQKTPRLFAVMHGVYQNSSKARMALKSQSHHYKKAAMRPWVVAVKAGQVVKTKVPNKTTHQSKQPVSIKDTAASTKNDINGLLS